MAKQDILSVVSVLTYSAPVGTGRDGRPDEETGITFLAQHLNCAMADGVTFKTATGFPVRLTAAELRAQYRAIWGTEWEPLPYCATSGAVNVTPHCHASADTITRI